ncbi:hypothetical protein MVES1_000437 [Malassezia vespertilionis]|uniref:uncharacterized protein n=1 Tax=Malassezia vespertilionis TaxID=2020962 RepID=UPI0024B0CCA6|nr:uncharacterized protein MVES1_000437 [Malassezia vespertilionis]WFD05111.1 hypothetical protein MVES1_000437 [Malassezia vespertilionis]
MSEPIEMAPLEGIKSDDTDTFSDRLNAVHSVDQYGLQNNTPIAVVPHLESTHERVGWTIWMLTVCAALSGSLFGYDTGYISAVLVTIKSDLGHPLSDWQKEMATAATSVGALIGAVCAMFPSEWFGRRIVIALANAVFIVGAIVQAAAQNIGTLIAGRLVVGIGVGVASMIVPLWIGELAPAHLRGRLVTLNVAFLTMGQLIANGVGAGFQHVKGGWRYTVAGGAIPAIISLISMAWLPESPRYDGRRGRIDKVTRTFQRIYPDASEESCRLRAEQVAEAVSEVQQLGKQLPFHMRLRKLFTGANAKALAIACGLQALQQLSGFNTLMSYSGTIFATVGLKEPLAVSMVVSATNFIGTLIAFKFIDIIGRRRVLLYTVPLMALALIFCCVCFVYISPVTINTDELNEDQINQTWADLLIVGIMFYVLFYALGLGNVPWQQGELFAIETRAIGTSIATATNWAFNLLINATYLSMVRSITASGAFGFYAGLCALGAVLIFLGYPDTRQLSLEEVHCIFKGSWGIRAAEELRAQKAQVARLAKARDAETDIDISTHVLVSSSTMHATESGMNTPRGSCPDEPLRKRDMLDECADDTVAAVQPTRITGSMPALPFNVPDSVHAARRSQSFSSPYTSMDEVDPIPIPLVDMSESTNPLSQMGYRGNALMLFVTCFASLGVFMFGYDQGVMSGILTDPSFAAYFKNPSATQIGTMVAILEIGAFITSLMSGVLADIYGRKRVIVWGALLFSLGGLAQTMANGFAMMVIGRFVSGFGVGFLSMIVPTYQSEVSPAENRGKLACIEFTGNIVGYMASIWFDYGCSFFSGNASWRVPLSVQPLIGLTLAFGCVLLPESPRWLLDKGQGKEAMHVLTDLHCTDDPGNTRAKLEYWEIQNSVLQMHAQGDRSYKAMWKTLRHRTLIGMSSQMFAQLNGINVISYYAPLVFESAGWLGRDAILMAGINAIVYVASTIPTWFLVDTWGRRPILLSGSLLCALTLMLCGLFLRANASYTPQAVVFCVILFNAAFGYSWGPIPWAWTPEIMPLAFRAKGASLSAATNWFFNWIVGQLTPVLQETIYWRLYILHAFFCLCSFVVVYYCYPETQGVPLEEMDTIFGDAGTRVPQNNDTLPRNGSDPEVYRIRRSISTHPRFLMDTFSDTPLGAAHTAERNWLAANLKRVYSAVAGLQHGESADRGEYETVAQ